MKIIQIQRVNNNKEVVSVCISEIRGNDRNIFYCPIDMLSTIVRLNID